MGKGVVILLGAIALWGVLEVYTEGPSRAFGGIFASSGAVEAEASVEPTLAEHRGSKVAGAHNEADDRRNRMLGQ
jgi:hypothetical protein